MAKSNTCVKSVKTYLVYLCLFVSVTSSNPVSVVDTKATNCNGVEVLPSFPLEKFNDKYYYFQFTFQGNYFQATQFCNHHDMRLLSIETKEENDYLWNYMQKFFGAGEYFFWTSGTTLTNNQWNWLATGKPIIFANWFPNQPDNAGNNEKCLEVRYGRNNKGLMWNDHGCTVAKYFICESAPPTKCRSANQ